MRTLYRVECSCGAFSCATNSRYEAQKIRTFHDQWNADVGNGEAHKVSVHALVQVMPRPENQAVLDVIATLEVPA